MKYLLLILLFTITKILCDCDYSNSGDIIAYPNVILNRTLDDDDAKCIRVCLESDDIFNATLYKDNDAIDQCINVDACDLRNSEVFNSGNYMISIEIIYDNLDNDYSTINYSYDTFCYEEIIYYVLILLGICILIIILILIYIACISFTYARKKHNSKKDEFANLIIYQDE